MINESLAMSVPDRGRSGKGCMLYRYITANEYAGGGRVATPAEFRLILNQDAAWPGTL